MENVTYFIGFLFVSVSDVSVLLSTKGLSPQWRSSFGAE